MEFIKKVPTKCVLGKGLIYIEALDDTHNLEELSTLTYEEFHMFLSFCNEKELDRLLTYMQNKGHTVCEMQVQRALSQSWF